MHTHHTTITILLTALLIFSCHESEPEFEVTVRDAVLQAHWDTFLHEAEIRDVAIRKLDMVIMLDTLAGWAASSQATRTWYMRFNRDLFPLWPYLWQELVFIHECGHSVFYYSHDEPNFIMSLYSKDRYAAVGYYASHREECLNEFFQSKPTPA